MYIHAYMYVYLLAVFHALDYLECLVVCLGLRKENSDMNQYIETIVARVMESCPEVLTAMPHRT